VPAPNTEQTLQPASLTAPQLLKAREGVAQCITALSRLITPYERLNPDGSRSIDLSSLESDATNLTREGAVQNLELYKTLFQLYLLRGCLLSADSLDRAISVGLNDENVTQMYLKEAAIWVDIAAVLGESANSSSGAAQATSNYVGVPNVSMEKVHASLRVGVNFLSEYARWIDIGHGSKHSLNKFQIAAVARLLQNNLSLVAGGGNFTREDVDNRLRENYAALGWATVTIGNEQLLNSNSVASKFCSRFSPSVGEIISSETDLATAFATFSKAVQVLNLQPKLNDRDAFTAFAAIRPIKPEAYTGSKSFAAQVPTAHQIRNIAKFEQTIP